MRVSDNRQFHKGCPLLGCPKNANAKRLQGEVSCWRRSDGELCGAEQVRSEAGAHRRRRGGLLEARAQARGRDQRCRQWRRGVAVRVSAEVGRAGPWTRPPVAAPAARVIAATRATWAYRLQPRRPPLRGRGRRGVHGRGHLDDEGDLHRRVHRGRLCRMCTPNSKQCGTEQTPETCTDQGEWMRNPMPCPNACTGMGHALASANPAASAAAAPTTSPPRPATRAAPG